MSRPERNEDQEGRDVGDVVPFPSGDSGAAERTPERPAAAAAGEGTGHPEIVDAEQPEVVPVDPQPKRPTVADRIALEQKFRPVLPPAVTDRDTRHAAERWFLARLLHQVAFHSVRAPWYLVQAVGFIPGGLARAVRELVAWAVDAEAVALRKAAGDAADAATWEKLERSRADRVRPRRIILGAGVLLAGVCWVLLQTLAPAWATWAALAAVLAWLSYLGRPRQRRWITRAIDLPEAPKLTSETVTRALGALGIPELRKAAEKGTGIGFPDPISQDGPGWLAVVELPHGVTAAEVMEKREKLASGLRRPLGCVWPEAAGEEHPGRLRLWCGHVDLRKARQPSWPLARKGAASVFDPVPFGTDQRGRPVGVDLMYSNLLVGSLPGAGKTMAIRIPLLFAALDPQAELRIAELKGTGDLSALERVAHFYVSGVDDDSIEAALDDLRYLHGELERRARVVAGLSKDLCPESKVTAPLAAKRSLGLHPIVAGIDECHELFSHETFGKDAGKLATQIIKRGRALGVILLLATQRPDTESLPTGVSVNVGVRFCLRVTDSRANNMILGSGAYAAGLQATMFKAPDLGIGWLTGHGPDAQVCRTYYIDGPASERIAARARAEREAAGTLAGHAAGETPEPRPTANLLDDLNTVYVQSVRADRPGEWSERLCPLLAELRPEVYGGWDQDALQAALGALQPLGIDTKQIAGVDDDGQRRNRRGVRRDDLTAALEARAERRQIGSSG